MDNNLQCSGINKKGDRCRWKRKKGYGNYCKRCFGMKEIFENTNMKRCNDCGKGFEGEKTICDKCTNRRNNKKKEKRNKIKICNYPNCKFKIKNDRYCGKHLRLGKKLENPELYCSKPNCPNLRIDGYTKCSFCRNNSVKQDIKRKEKRKEIPENICKTCRKLIENYLTDSGKKLLLCKKHYDINKTNEIKRVFRNRDWNNELKIYKFKYPLEYENKLIKKR